MVTVNVNPINPEGELDNAATVDFALCGYGSQNPRTQTGGAAGTFSNPALLGIGVNNELGGEPISVELVGNDTISPPGTYYTVTMRNGNGDILQCNAYIFLDGQTYDLGKINPFDPSQPVPPLPPLIFNQLLLIAFSPTPNFPGDQYTALAMTLSGDVTSSTMTGQVAGNLYTFILSQDGTGGWSFVWPTAILNATPINPAPRSITIQTFVCIGNNGPLLPIGPGTYFP